MRISQAAERTDSGRTRRKIRETEILRAVGGGGGAASRASPVAHGATAQCQARSGSRLEVFNPKLWRLGFTADGRGHCPGALVIPARRELQIPSV